MTKSREMEPYPVDLKLANDFVDSLHRHHSSVHRDKYRLGCTFNGKLVGERES